MALSLVPQASNVALPPALVPPNPQNSPLNSVVNTVIDATQAGITAAANRLQSNNQEAGGTPSGPMIAAVPPASARPASAAPAPAPTVAGGAAVAAAAAFSSTPAPLQNTGVHTTNIIAGVRELVFWGYGRGLTSSQSPRRSLGAPRRARLCTDGSLQEDKDVHVGGGVTGSALLVAVVPASGAVRAALCIHVLRNISQ